MRSEFGVKILWQKFDILVENEILMNSAVSLL